MAKRLYNMNLPNYPLLSESETIKLLKQAKRGSQEAREKLVNHNLRLVFNLIQRFEGRGYDLEDLFQIGTIGLLKAVDRFDPQYQVKFSTYAVPMIIGEIRRFLRDDSLVKVSRTAKDMAYRVNRAREELSKRNGREPTVGEIADQLGVKREDIVSALEAVKHPESVHDTLYQDEGDPIYILDQLRHDGCENQLLENLAVRQVLEKLPPRYKEIILLRFFYDKTQAEVARIVGLSQVQISRLERRALEALRESLHQEQAGCP